MRCAEPELLFFVDCAISLYNAYNNIACCAITSVARAISCGDLKCTLHIVLQIIEYMAYQTCAELVNSRRCEAAPAKSAQQN